MNAIIHHPISLRPRRRRIRISLTRLELMLLIEALDTRAAELLADHRTRDMAELLADRAAELREADMPL